MHAPRARILSRRTRALRGTVALAGALCVCGIALAGSSVADGREASGPGSHGHELAQAGPCAGETEPSVAGPIAQLLSPQDVAAGPEVFGAPPTPRRFSGRDACDLPGSCAAAVEPTNEPKSGVPPSPY